MFEKSDVVVLATARVQAAILIPPLQTPDAFVVDGLDTDRWVRAEWRTGADPALGPPERIFALSVMQAMSGLDEDERRFVLAATERAVDWSFDEGWIEPGDDEEARDRKGHLAAVGLRLQIEVAEWRAAQPVDISPGCRVPPERR